MEVINRYKNKQKTKERKQQEKKIKKQTKKRNNSEKKRERSRCNVTQRCDLDRLDHFNWSETTGTHYFKGREW
jgi:hypothetical protein